MRGPTTATHLLGKLLKHIGEDNVLWGTDALWYGSPQTRSRPSEAFKSLHGSPHVPATVVVLTDAPSDSLCPRAPKGM